jgi:hypothetical protein
MVVECEEAERPGNPVASAIAVSAASSAVMGQLDQEEGTSKEILSVTSETPPEQEPRLGLDLLPTELVVKVLTYLWHNDARSLHLVAALNRHYRHIAMATVAKLKHAFDLMTGYRTRFDPHTGACVAGMATLRCYLRPDIKVLITPILHATEIKASLYIKPRFGCCLTARWAAYDVEGGPEVYHFSLTAKGLTIVSPTVACYDAEIRYGDSFERAHYDEGQLIWRTIDIGRHQARLPVLAPLSDLHVRANRYVSILRQRLCRVFTQTAATEKRWARGPPFPTHPISQPVSPQEVYTLDDSSSSSSSNSSATNSPVLSSDPEQAPDETVPKAKKPRTAQSESNAQNEQQQEEDQEEKRQPSIEAELWRAREPRYSFAASWPIPCLVSGLERRQDPRSENSDYSDSSSSSSSSSESEATSSSDSDCDPADDVHSTEWCTCEQQQQEQEQLDETAQMGSHDKPASASSSKRKRDESDPN